MRIAGGRGVPRIAAICSTLSFWAVVSFSSSAAAQTAAPAAPAGPAASATPAPGDQPSGPQDQAEHEHSMELAGGPTLNFRGFMDLNLGVGSDANPLVYPLGVPTNTSFQLGEFDLFITSKLSDHISFLAELVFGFDATNYIGADLERVQLTYTANKYFQVSGGRYHTAIGYYNTAFHHGTWFQTATGRPFMYFFEDSGGTLPVHNVGATATGLVPDTGSTGLHWIAEVGNGRSSSLNPVTNPVQNFQSDRNYKSNNFAAYIKPDWLHGLQMGANTYHDHLFPVLAGGATQVNESITGVYGVYITSIWEFMNEAVFMRNTISATGQAFDSKLMYTQLSRKFGRLRPYVREQYVRSPIGDPVNAFIGKYAGPSLGLRYDVSAFVALKAQYNRLYTGGPVANGVDFQAAFAF
jgi:hypothetical protein